MRAVILGLMLAALAACSTGYRGNESSPFYTVPVGSRIVLNRPLTIPSDQLGVLFQNGKPVTRVTTYYPHCKLELRDLAGSERTVAPGEFVVTRVSRLWGHSVGAGTIQLADATRVRHLLANNDKDGGPSIRAFVTFMDLGSDQQPEVSRLSCGVWGYPREDQHVSIEEIRRALGDVVTVRTSGPRG